MGQVDPERLVVRRATERELVPNKGGATLGISPWPISTNAETWVTTSEGMGTVGLEKQQAKYGANGRVYAARIMWEVPNAAWDKH